MAVTSASSTAHSPHSDGMAQALHRIDLWWRAANYLSIGQIYLLDNPLIREPLSKDHVKPRLLGHWGTTPGINFVWAHLNRVIQERQQKTLFITGPGHGGPGLVANAWIEGTYSETYSGISHDAEGMKSLFRQFSFPGGIPSHAAPETPGSIHEGGELGYSLSHAFGAAFDNPDLVVAAVVGDGEAETGPLATSWHSNAFLNPVRDGVVLPILHLNGYKIANPTILARMPEAQLLQLMRGYGYSPHVVSGGFDGEDPMLVHERMARTLDLVFDEIAAIRQAAANGLSPEPANELATDPADIATGNSATDSAVDSGPSVPAWPMIILRTPKGWTCPAEIDGLPVENTWRAHQVPLASARDTPEHTELLQKWLASYKPDELFDERGAPLPEITALAPEGELRMSATPFANGGILRRALRLPDFSDFAADVPAPGATIGEATRVLGSWLAAVIRNNPDNFRIFGPDETASNRLQGVFDATEKQWLGGILPIDEHLARAGRVMEMLSEHQCQGWLEGYLLTGRHGLFNCYEAFIHIVDSMVNQHAKWLKVSSEIPWRRSISSLNYLLSSHVWRQDHNGFSHQDPGFMDHMVNKKADIVRIYLPPDANTLLSTYDHCLRSSDYINVVIAGKQPSPNWLTIEQASEHCARGLGIWDWAGTEGPDENPDVVLACAGDVPTLETLAAAALLREHLPALRVRVVNVVDLMRLQDASEHPHGLTSREFDTVFTADRPIIFAFHGYPTLIHRLTYRRTGHANLHARGFIEEGTTTTPFDMVMLNDLDRYRLVMDVIDRVPGLASRAASVRQRMQDARLQARAWTREHGEDIPAVATWRWGFADAVPPTKA